MTASLESVELICIAGKTKIGEMGVSIKVGWVGFVLGHVPL